MTAVNATEMRVVGMSRSGNHAIIDWILAQARGRWCYLNCAEPEQNPFAWARPLGPEEPGHRASYDLDIGRERAGRLSRKDLLLHSYEDVPLHHFADAAAEARLHEEVGPSARRFDVLILRDPYNLFASRRAARAGILDEELAMSFWCEHARETLGVTRHLGNTRVLVSYNAWCASRAYRARLARVLGLRFDDRTAKKVPAVAGGSSFDGVRFDGSATDMRLTERWRHYAGDESFARLFTPEVRRLATAVFGELNGPDAVRTSAPARPRPSAADRAA